MSSHGITIRTARIELALLNASLVHTDVAILISASLLSLKPGQSQKLYFVTPKLEYTAGYLVSASVVCPILAISFSAFITGPVSVYSARILHPKR